MAASHEELKKELTEMITKDISALVEMVVRKRVGLFVDEIYLGIRGNKTQEQKT